jgi:hypothetical protein
MRPTLERISRTRHAVSLGLGPAEDRDIPPLPRRYRLGSRVETHPRGEGRTVCGRFWVWRRAQGSIARLVGLGEVLLQPKATRVPSTGEQAAFHFEDLGGRHAEPRRAREVRP